MLGLSRSTALKIAAVLSFIIGVLTFVIAIPFIVRGSADVNTTGDAPPFAIIVSALTFAVIRIVAAFGTWKAQRWSIIMTILANGIDAVTALPGILFAPTQTLWLSAIVSVVSAIIIIVLCLSRERKSINLQA